MSFDLSNHFEEDMVLIEKFNPTKALTVLYYSEIKKAYFLKRFIPELSDKKVCMFPEEDGNKFVIAVTDKRPQIRVEYDNEGAKKPVDPEEIVLDEFVEVMGVKAKGKKLSNHPVSVIAWLDPIPVEEEELESEDDEEDIQDEEMDQEIDNEIETESVKEKDSETEVEGEPEEGTEIESEEGKMEEKVKGKVEGKEKAVEKGKAKPKAKEKEAKKEIREEKIVPPFNPPDFPDDDDEAGRGIQMTLF